MEVTMKTISKKIKTIYLLAMMAIISVCIAVFPVFKTETVKAEESGFGMAGATVQFSEKKGANDFALMFQAKITKDWYMDNVDGLSDDIKFGMAIVPNDQLGNVTSYEDLVAYAESVSQKILFTDLIGTSLEGDQLLEFAEDQTEITYEAGTYFFKNDAAYDGEDITADMWKIAYAKDLTAIPFYSIDGGVVDYETSYAQAYTTNAAKVTLDTFIAETALPTDSEERTVSDADFKAVTGYTLSGALASGREIYLDMGTNKFFTNFFRGGTSASYINWAFMRTWWPWALSKGASSQLGTNAGRPTYFAGGELTTKLASETTALSSTYFTNMDAIPNLEAGEDYRLMYKLSTSADDTAFYTATYKPVTRVFTGVTSGMSTQGATLQKSYTMKEGGSAVVQTSYFSLNISGSNLYMPYIQSTKTDKYDVENYDGYYVLAGDMIVPDVVSGSAYNYTNSSGKITSANVVSAPTTTANIPRMSFGALKGVPAYINKFNTTLMDHAFTGTFDGRGYTIDASFTRGGLFGVINGGTVKNLNVKADLYTYSISGTQTAYTEDSYMEKAAVLAEVICGGATIENVAIELVENAPKTFTKYSQNGSGTDLTDIPEMNNVPGIIASQQIERSTLKNVIVRCDALKDADKSLQNFRAALNVAGNCTLENVFVIGSSYSNMSIDVVDVTEGEGEEATVVGQEYVLTLSAPAGVEPGTYAVGDDETLAPYFAMATDMFKFMQNIDVSNEIVKVKFVAEPATMKFANEEAFQAYLNGDGAAAKEALIATGRWAEVEGALVWKNEPVEGTTQNTYKVVANTMSYKVPVVPTADTTTDIYSWVGFAGYNPSITIAG